MNSNNSNDVIEISDDSNDLYASNSGTSSSQGTKRNHSTLISDSSSSSDSSSNSDVEYIENESASEPDLDCDVWDDDCVVSDIKPKTALINGFHLMPTCEKEPESITKKSKVSLELNEALTQDDFKKLLKENFSNDNAYSDKTCEIICDPWKVLVVNNIVSDIELLEEARREMYEIPWNKRTLDLYEFFQSEDLKNVKDAESVKVVYDFLRNELKTWVEYLTGLELTEVSATCSFYGDTDFLIVHDDQNENRAVAFVLYLTGSEGWEEEWGGNLQLFEKDENRQPRKCTRSILPKNNQLVLFPVSDCSYHQVEEVVSKNYARMSINGWFHVKEPLKFEAPLYKSPETGLFSENYENFSEIEFNVNDWINHSYFEEKVKQSIHYCIEEGSEHSLEYFFNGTKMQEVFQTISDKDIKWEKMGPPNRRNYEYIKSTENLPPVLSEFINIFKSCLFVNLLKDYTELELTKMKWELQKWTPGSYSLLHEDNKNQLDAIVFIGDLNVVGGKVNYVTLMDEVQNALVTVPPTSDGTLNLVYGDTARFTSNVSKHTKSSPYFMLVAAYFEDEEDEQVEDLKKTCLK